MELFSENEEYPFLNWYNMYMWHWYVLLCSSFMYTKTVETYFFLSLIFKKKVNNLNENFCPEFEKSNGQVPTPSPVTAKIY